MGYKYVGKSIQRTDAYEKVTGEAKYLDDIYLPGMYYAKILHSTEAHAKILSIDVKEASSSDGVYKVITGKNCKYIIGVCIIDHPPIAVDRVRHAGEPVAVVVARTEEEATAALKKIKVKYQPLPAVFDPIESTKKTAPLIHDGKANTLPSFNPIEGTNIFHHFKIRKGDVKKGFAEADYTAEWDFEWPHISHAQLEPHGTITNYNSNTGELEMYTTAQSPFTVREFLSHGFHIPMSKLSIKVGYLGGGFGGKSDVTLEPLSTYVAMQCPGIWIKLVVTREEMFAGTLVGRGFKGHAKFGANKEGKLTVAEVTYYLNSGAYGEGSINVATGAGYSATGPYFIPNLKIDSMGVYTNLPYPGAFRGYGVPEAHLMAESLMNILAEKLNMDPVEFRLKNLLAEGLTNSMGQVIHKSDGNPTECGNIIKKKLRWQIGKDNGDRNNTSQRYLKGKGVAFFVKAPNMAVSAFSGAAVRFNEDGTINITISCTEMGQGSLTVLKQIGAEVLKCDIEKISINKNINTRFTPYEWQTVASRTTWMVGNAIARAAADAIRQLKENAALALETPDGLLEYDGKKIYLKDHPEKSIEIATVANGYMTNTGKTIGRPVFAVGYFVPFMEFTDENGQGNLASSFTFGAQGVEITIDKITAEITVDRMITAIDPGKVINPKLVAEQINGGMTMAMGSALMEQVIYNDKGQVRNAGFTDYIVVQPEDVKDTKMESYFVETLKNYSVYGAKPMAEHPIVGIGPAILMAIYNATGIRFNHVPIVQDELKKELLKKGI